VDYGERGSIVDNTTTVSHKIKNNINKVIKNKFRAIESGHANRGSVTKIDK
jgi:hypothetical protein